MTEPTTLRFAKYEGLGNDFMIVDTSDEALLDATWISKACDRHFGVGADGVLFVMPPKSLGARATMVVLNADGSRPEMCGNGLRCVALHLALLDRSPGASFIVDTDAGPRLVAVERNDVQGSIAVGMGRGKPEGELSYAYLGAERRFALVSMGNPHAVCFDAGLDEPDLDRLGPELSSQFPAGTNVEIVTLRGDRVLDVLVWERGVGRTLACGTGACAVAVAAAREGRVPFEVEVEVQLPGGSLQITVARETLDVTMRGPARRVFSGEVSLR